MSDPQQVCDTNLLIARRNRWAGHARTHDFLLRRCAEDLRDRLSTVTRTFSRALVLGAYHGIVSDELKKLSAIDWLISAETADRLRQQCRGPTVSADIEWLPFQAASLDLIVSPLSLQFVNDLPGALAQVRRALKNDGLFMAAMIGGESLTELRQSWLQAEAEISDGAAPRIVPFADIRDLGALLQRAGFALPVVDTDRITVTYETPLALMNELRAMAASNPLIDRSRTPVTRSIVLRAAEVYQDNFGNPDSGRIPATFDIMWLTAWAPDASQQKPLAPGSARVRLADALGVNEQQLKDKQSNKF